MNRIPRLSVSEAVYSAVKQVLLSEYSPGERIGIDELCRALEVSRTPVFEALNRLKAEGIVEIIPRRGAYLVTFSIEKAQELYVVRESLEGLATKLAAERLTMRQIDGLRKALDAQSSCLEAGDLEGYADATIDFHDTIVEAAGNKTLSQILGTIYAQIKALRLRNLYLPERLASSFAEHQRIFAALVARDAEAAGHEARMHIETTTADVLEILARAPEDHRQTLSLVQSES